MRGLRMLAAALLLLVGMGPAVAGQAKRAPANWLTTVVRTPEGGYRQGNPNAAIKLIEYGSRGCPTCGRFAAEGVEPLRREWVATGKLSYEFRDYLIHGAPDFALALLNQCVPTARFFPVLDRMFANQRAFAEQLEKVPMKTLEGYQQLPVPQMATRFAEAMGAIAFMKQLGVPEAQSRRCLTDPVAIKRIAQTNADAANVHGVDSTPSFFVNGRKVRAYSWAALQPELRAADN
ncbi:thioredoxin domain-containing protein [Sphingomonas sp.]|uniref:DsbA family protein n=1 Tax=Sphingomonas sp. TaxID=28214 RepID=UPI0025F2B1C6|nr:thioredoxin domain-containing protein [Sphingomonas sp.]